MADRFQVYKCELCENIVEVVHTGGGELACCGQAMTLMAENTVDASVEKHKPVVEKLEHGSKVSVGSDPHPMTDEHYIEWIEVVTEDGKSNTKYLNPGDDPEATFCVDVEGTVARAYCNLHGHWKA